MAEFRARLAPPLPERGNWPYHQVEALSLPVKALFKGDRRLEADCYLHSGYGLRAALEAPAHGWQTLGALARVWQPSRLKGIQVSPEYGTPFLAATQVFDLRPIPRKWLSLERTESATERFVTPGTIVVTCSGAVGRATLAYSVHAETLISHDLLRVAPNDKRNWGWLYAYLRAPTVRQMMTSAQYGHVIKHLETSHLGALPVPILREPMLDYFNEETRAILDLRERAHTATLTAESLFEQAVGPLPPASKDTGFIVDASYALFTRRRRLEAAYSVPSVTAILAALDRSGSKVEVLSDVTNRVWWMSRFKRVLTDQQDDVPYMSAEELFALNPLIEKRIAVRQAKNAEAYHVKSGWLVMACSGQTYGLLGSVVLVNEAHEQAFFSHDLIRIIPNQSKIRSGYLHTALSHPRLGRPLVVRYAYGTSIPHIEPSDVATMPIVRLDPALERDIADLAEQAAAHRADADLRENAIADAANGILARFAAGDIV